VSGESGGYLTAEHERQPGASLTGYQLQAKWAQALTSAVSVGLSAGPTWQAHVRPRYQGTTVAALASWSVSDSIGLHANVGRDFLHQASDEPRAGASVDWSFSEGWQVMAERYRQEGGHLVRVGLRWEPAENWTVDLSRAHHLRGAGQSSWTVGLKREFGR
jgi:hypothetical protein